ncbi:type II secretion system protein N [Marinicellulosiphila megalodicopiae]|uniref:type II secretion system protein N n=1 Tax=Marinicellulosiphila megalodicopiae TaxID=2724896 RepID=UPI003BB03831
MAVLNLQNIWVRRLISIGFILTVAVIAHILALLTWGLIVTPSYSYSSEIELPKRDVKSTAMVSDTVNASRIANVHLFGQFAEIVVEQPIEVVQPKVEPKATPLKFVLMATAANVSLKNGMASIAEGRDTQWFRVGDDVFEKATLHAVYADKVEFERDNGEIEILEFKKDKLFDYKEYVAPERGANLGSEFEYEYDESSSENKSYSSRENPTFKPSGVARGVSSNSNELPEIVTTLDQRESSVEKVQSTINENANVKNQVERYVSNQITKSNPVSMLSQYGLKHIPGKGYQVTSRARDLMLLGLRAGDIIISINGNKATTPEQDIQLIDGVMSSGEILIEYERNGKVLVMKQALLQF